MKTMTKNTRILVPAAGPEDWRRFLAKPDVHWQEGHSARTLAHSWHDKADLPPEIRTALEGEFGAVDLLLAVPEWQVPLPGGDASSQNDVWALCSTGTRLISVAVEGKVDEPFGPTVSEWMAKPSVGRTERMAFLCDTLGVVSPPPGPIRYQLLHRTASAILEARRFHARHAVMLVHSFSQRGQWFEDYRAFALLLGANVDGVVLAAVPGRDQPSLHLGWVQGDPRFLMS